MLENQMYLRGREVDWCAADLTVCPPGCCCCYIAAAFSWLSCAATDAVNSADLTASDARNAF